MITDKDITIVTDVLGPMEVFVDVSAFYVRFFDGVVVQVVGTGAYSVSSYFCMLFVIWESSAFREIRLFVVDCCYFE